MNLGKSLKPQLLQNLMLSIHPKKMYEKDNVNKHKKYAGSSKDVSVVILYEDTFNSNMLEFLVYTKYVFVTLKY